MADLLLLVLLLFSVSDVTAYNSIYGSQTRISNVNGLYNVAVGMRASQSSVGHGGLPSRAVDGNRNGHFRRRSCTHTSRGDPNPWWSLELGQDHTVDRVVIWNRVDCCRDRLAGLRVSVFSPVNGVAPNDGNTLCHTEDSVLQNPLTYRCNREIPGEYVLISRPGDSRALALCEVEVYSETPPSACMPNPCENGGICRLNGQDGAPYFCECPETYVGNNCEVSIFNENGQRNLALGKPASQSSTERGGVASRAVDGNRDGDFARNSCTLTAQGSNYPWWRVDLGQIYTVDQVVIWNRVDCCMDRLQGLGVSVFETVPVNSVAMLYDDNFQCHAPEYSVQRNPVTYNCNHMKPGQYVHIGRSYFSSAFSEALSLCEVEVYAQPAPPGR